MKKLIALLLLSVMLVGVFCGCGDSSDSTDTESKEHTIAQETLIEKFKHIQYQRWGSAQTHFNYIKRIDLILKAACPEGYAIECSKYDIETLTTISQKELMTWEYCDNELTNTVIDGTYDKNLDNAYLVWVKGRCLSDPRLIYEDTYYDNYFRTDKDSVLTLYLLVFDKDDQLVDSILCAQHGFFSSFCHMYMNDMNSDEVRNGIRKSERFK